MTAPPTFTARQVGCPECGAGPDDPCYRLDGAPAKNHHSRRIGYAIAVTEKAAIDPWYRFRARRRGAPRVPLPCGSRSAAIRHQRNGEELDPACAAALKTWERERSRRRRAAERVVAG